MRLPHDDRLGVVEQVLPDARQVVHDGYAELLQVGARADAGVQQQARRVHGPGAHQDLAPGAYDVLRALLGTDVHAGGAGALQLQPVRPGLQGDVQVRPVQERVEIGHGGGGPLVVLRVVGEVEEADALVEGCLVEAFDARNSQRALRGVDEVPGDRVPVGVVDGDDVVAQPGEVGIHGCRVPAVGAGLRPLVPVGGQGLEGDEGVVRGAAAQHPRTAVADVRVAPGLLGGGVVVVELTAEQAHPSAQGEDVVAADVAGAALDDGDADVRVFGQPGGDDGSGGATADDDVVVHVLVVHAWSFAVAPANQRTGRGARLV